MINWFYYKFKARIVNEVFNFWLSRTETRESFYLLVNCFCFRSLISSNSEPIYSFLFGITFLVIKLTSSAFRFSELWRWPTIDDGRLSKLKFIWSESAVNSPMRLTYWVGILKNCFVYCVHGIPGQTDHFQWDYSWGQVSLNQWKKSLFSKENSWTG